MDVVIPVEPHLNAIVKEVSKILFCSCLYGDSRTHQLYSYFTLLIWYKLFRLLGFLFLLEMFTRCKTIFWSETLRLYKIYSSYSIVMSEIYFKLSTDFDVNRSIFLFPFIFDFSLHRGSKFCMGYQQHCGIVICFWGKLFERI